MEEIGVERWLATQKDARLQQTYLQWHQRKQDFLHLLLRHRVALEENYQRIASESEKLQRKQAIFHQLKEDYQMLKQHWGGYAGYDRWFSAPLFNAHLASVATYHEFVPAFRALFEQKRSLPCFYAAANRLAKLDKAARKTALTGLANSGRH